MTHACRAPAAATAARRAWWPSVRNGAGVVLLFAAALWIARESGGVLQALADEHRWQAMALFALSSAVAVLLPLASNLPLVPFASLWWGPAATAALLIAGWVVGAVLSFALGRRAGQAIRRWFPSVQRHADIDRLIHPRHRLLSLVMLRATFPVDVLSYALGLFSRGTRARDNALSTAVGGAPFALLFAWVPVLPAAAQAAVLVASVLAFVLYVRWMLRRAPPAPPAPQGPTASG